MGVSLNNAVADGIQLVIVSLLSVSIAPNNRTKQSPFNPQVFHLT